MNAQLVERLEKMHRMLAKTHEEVKVLRIEVNTLHQALSSGDDIPPPMDNKQSRDHTEAMEKEQRTAFRVFVPQPCCLSTGENL